MVYTATEYWFSEFLFQNIEPSETELFNFHKTAREADTSSNLIMDQGFIKTKYIIQILKAKNELMIKYEDLQMREISDSEFRIK